MAHRSRRSEEKRLAFLAWNDPANGKPAQAVDVTDKEDRITTIIVDI